MDIPRSKRASPKLYWYGSAAFGAIAFVTVALTGLGPAVPSVERSTIFTDVVRRGTMLREVRGPGTLVPEQIRWVPAVTAGRVERKLVQPGTVVDSATLLVVLSNPDVQLEMLEAERQLSQAQAELVNLETNLATQQLNQEGVVATVRAQSLEARRNVEASRELGARQLLAEAEVQTAVERAEELGTRLELERRRLQLMQDAMGAQLDVQVTQVSRLQNIVGFHRQRIESMNVRAGASGVLQDMDLEEGQWVLPGQTLARVVQPRRLKVELRVPEVQARDVALGLPVTIDTRRDTIPGQVIRIDPAVQNGAVLVDVGLQGELPQGARPDLSVDGVITIERIDEALFVGRPSFGQAQATVAMFRLTPDGRYADRVTVRLGRGSVNAIEILGGLNAGDRVILSDMTRFEDEQRVRIK